MQRSKIDITKKAKELMREYDMDPISAHMIAIEWQRNEIMMGYRENVSDADQIPLPEFKVSIDVAQQFFSELVELIASRKLLPNEHFAMSSDLTEVVFRFNECYKYAKTSKSAYSEALPEKKMLKDQLMGAPAFIRGQQRDRFRIKRGSILDLGFKTSFLPTSLQRTLIDAWLA